MDRSFTIRYSELGNRQVSSDESDQQILLAKLSKYKQASTTPIEDHCIKWENLLHQLILPIPEKRKVQLFALSLFDVQVKVTITTRFGDNLASAIEAAIWIINDCQPAPPTYQPEAAVDPMDWTDAPIYNVQVQPAQRETSYEPRPDKAHNEINSNPYGWMLRLYDKQGRQSVDYAVPNIAQ